MKKLAALVLSAALMMGSAAAVTPEEAFPKVNDYPGYSDVQPTDWFASAAQACYEVGLMTGTNTGFSPKSNLTVAQVATIAARMHAAITGESIPIATPKPDQTLPWYFSYVHYLEQLGIAVPDPEKDATRQEFVDLLCGVVPEDMLSPINTVTALPDSTDPDVLAFYNAGILTGMDQWGTFLPDKTLTRAEAAAMVARVARTGLRQTFTPADYTPFTAAGLKPSDVLFTNGTTAGAWLPYVQALIDGLEQDCAAAGLEFNWFNTVDGVEFLDYVKNTALSHFGVTAKDGTDAYKTFDVQVYYSKVIDLRT